MTSAPDDRPRTCFVTGAGSGVGLAMVMALSQAKHRVFAGARCDSDLTHLATLPGVTAAHLDLLDAASAQAAKAHLRDQPLRPDAAHHAGPGAGHGAGPLPEAAGAPASA